MNLPTAKSRSVLLDLDSARAIFEYSLILRGSCLVPCSLHIFEYVATVRPQTDKHIYVYFGHYQ
jgi:hypothetical protein